MGIVALVLAAGKSSRMGRDKLSMRLHAVWDKSESKSKTNTNTRSLADHTSCSPVSDVANMNNPTVGGRVLSTLLQVSELSSIVIVHSPQSSRAWKAQCRQLQQLHHERMELVVCKDAELGMSYSIRCGVQYVRENSQAQAMMIVLADQPLLEPAHVQQLVAHMLTHPELHYVAAAGQDGAAPPIVFAASIWDRLEQLSGDQGARRLLQDTSLHGEYVQLPEYCFWDADTPVALERIQQYITEMSKRVIEHERKH
ncbi:nucleotidyltransferase family protein [Paenibacillus wenxiniae]|uniref:Nucleotidyltransferase family protein n=1 Tax=Paenibacillus wenxiniae TaxID=1636843 RepID=A0ABW4RRK3_9BACL